MSQNQKDVAIIDPQGRPLEPAPPAAVPPATSVLAIIERAAMDPTVDVERLQSLLSMQKDIMAIEAKREFHDALAEAQADMAPVVKNCENSQTRSRYADINAIAEAIDPVIRAHGFSTSFTEAPCGTEGSIRILGKLRRGGHEEETYADIPIDMTGLKGTQNKTATHGHGSALTYGRRYVKMLMFDIATAERDDDGNRAGSQAITQAQYQELARLLETEGITEADEKNFLTSLNCEHLPALPVTKLELAKDRLQRKIRSLENA